MFTYRTWRGWLCAWGLAVLMAACTTSGGGTDGTTTTTLNPSLPNIVSTSTLAVGSTCENGGVHVDWGVDTNGNGVLDSSEITGGGDICNGTAGPAGLTPTVHVDPLASAEQCASGSGQQVTIWMDVNANGEIDPAEEGSVSYAVVCDGATGAGGFAALVAIDIEQPGDNCPYGGLVILSGQDLSGDGSLGEGDGPISTHYTCNTGGGPLVQVPHWQAPWYGYAVASVSASTWSGVTCDAAPDACVTGSEPTMFYDSYLLANRTDADEVVDVGVDWQPSRSTVFNLAAPLGAAVPPLTTGLSQPMQSKDTIPSDGIIRVVSGNTTLYDYPFSALDPLTNILDWNNSYEESLAANWLTFTLTPGETVVLVPSPMGEFTQSGYALSVAASQAWDVTGIEITVDNPASTPGTVAEGAVERRRISGLSAGATYQAIVTSAVAGDDMTIHTHAGPFADWDCGYASSTDPEGYSVNACAFNADSNGWAWLEVLGVASASPAGAGYSLQVRVPPPSEGPVALDVGVPYADGTVGPSPTDTSSYVRNQQLTAGTLYTVRLSNLYPAGSLDVTLTGTVEADNTCYGHPDDTVIECSIRVTTDEVLVLSIGTEADASYNQGGATYTIELMPGAEGDADHLTGIPVGADYAGSVDDSSSWYAPGEAGTGNNWSVDLSNIEYYGTAEVPSLGVTLTSYDNYAETNYCDITGTDGTCSLSMATPSTVIVTVDGMDSNHGATYTINLYQTD